ncbi:hypothetical protein AAFF_G00023570 [Aldrovandia affinis]|uniref:Kinesin motor domain-containing protein n=1 Tax=Aldrovandia affinis TaxID=143900 RepID=A0AAD7T5L6_9TELE|nr:hypothetical protein AAFF_G00023570 [Aldrovandia affinis]
MTSCLYECLYEAGLQRYYPQFVALGLSRLAHLSRLTMGDYPRFGVQDMCDRTRLFHLVQLVKGFEEEVDDSEDEDEGGVTAEAVLPARRPPPRRQLAFSAVSPKPEQPRLAHTPVGGAQTDTETPFQNLHIKKEARRHGSHILTRTPKLSNRFNKEVTPRNSSHTDKLAPADSKVRGENRWVALMHRKSLLEQEVAPVYQVKCTPSYNYGLPISSPASSRRTMVGRAAVERIRVCLRKRPLSRAEENSGVTDVVMAQDGESVLVHEQKEAVDLTEYVLQHAFYFDEVFSEACTNEDVYEKTAYPLIQHIFNGGKATCFAYGQTGAGKTHTMLGSSRRPGLYALAARDIFARLARTESGSSPVQPPGPFTICVSFFEIYCGQLYDLLDHRKRLFAREDSQHVVQIAGLREVEVESVATLLEVISWGSRERSRGVSGVNCDSSRSHALLQIHLRDCTHRLVGRISFVDLAGSERACDTRDLDRQSRMEGAEINQSLLALKECIRALDQEQLHTPFRQSKLTQVLKDSFIGNSKTCMIANISPGHLATEHTLNTLRYADRVKELKRGRKSSPNRSGAGGKTLTNLSPKRNKHSSREKSPSKKAMAGLAGHEGAGEVGLDHTTPIRGTLGRRQSVTERRSKWQSERGEEEEGIEEEGRSARLGARVRPVWKETVAWETLGGWGDEREPERDGKREETERERHLKRYHQQLQQFQPSAALQRGRQAQPLAEDLLASYGERVEEAGACQAAPIQHAAEVEGCPGPSRALEFGSSSSAGGRFPNSLGGTWEMPLPGTGSGTGVGETGRGGLGFRADGRGWAGQSGSRRECAVGEREGQGQEESIKGYRDRCTPVSSGLDLGLGEGWGLGVGDEAESWERVREAERESDGLARSDWSIEDDDYGAYLSTESSGSNNNIIPVERPLSPPRDGIFLQPEDLNDLSTEHKRVNPVWGAEDPLRLPFGSDSVNIPMSPTTAPLMTSWRRESEETGPGDALMTPPVLTREAQAAVMLSTRAEPRSRIHPSTKTAGGSCGAATHLRSVSPSRDSSTSVVDSSISTMDPLSISLLQVETQVATDSFLGCGSRFPSLSPEGHSGKRGGAGEPQLLLEALLGVKSCCEHSESAVTPDGQRRQQRVVLDSTFLCMKGVKATTDPSLSLTPFPGSFLEALAQPEADILGLRKAEAPLGVSHPRDRTAKPGSHASSAELSQSEPSLAEASPPESAPVPEKSAKRRFSGNCVGTETETVPGGRQGDQDLPHQDIRRAMMEGQRLIQEILKTGGPGKPGSAKQDPSQQSDPTVPLYPRLSGTPAGPSTTHSLREGLELAQRLVVQAHCEQLEEMESLCHRVEALLSLQPGMDFTDYVLQLEEIMELKAKCVRNMSAQLRLYLTCPCSTITDTHAGSLTR